MKYLAEPGQVLPNSIFIDHILDNEIEPGLLVNLEQKYLQMFDHNIHVTEREYLIYLKEI